MYLINQYGRLGILEFWNLEYNVIFFLFTFYWESKFLIGRQGKKFSVITGLRSRKKEVNKFYEIFEIPKFENTQSAQLIDEMHTT